MTRSWYAEVVAVGTSADQIGQVKASWPDVGEYPEWIDMAPSPVLVMPAVGDFVEVSEREDEQDRYEWHGIRQVGNVPSEVSDAHPQVAAVLPPARRCYLVLDDRDSVGFALLKASAGAYLRVRSSGNVQAVAPTGSQVELGAEGLVLLDGVVTGQCNCAFTGAPHPVTSLVVRAKKGP